MKYNKTVVAREALEETNDCAVMTLATALDIPYELAHEAFELAGREVGASSSTKMLDDAFGSLGYRLGVTERSDSLFDGEILSLGDALVECSLYGDGGSFLFYAVDGDDEDGDGHVVGMRDGRVDFQAVSFCLDYRVLCIEMVAPLEEVKEHA